MTDPVLGPVKGDVTAECVLTALAAGRAMRTHQKKYFATRQQAALDASRVAERAFDEALANALWWIRHGEPRPVQGELFA